jgi:RNase H-fold protein (predicted Holliday junction resolvase)
VILGIDPGTRKAGYALIAPDGTVIAQGIEEVEALVAKVERFAAEREIRAVALGTGTNSRGLRTSITALGLSVTLVDEHETTLRARRLYFADHPPRGWRRLVPLGMQLPPRPIDDYAAVLIARRFLADEGPPK